MTRRPTLLAASLISLALVAAACGDDDVGVGAGGPDPTATAASTTAPPAEALAGSDGPRLVSAGTSFGMCLGFCERTLSVDGASVTMEAVDREGPTRTVTGTLSGDAAADLAAAVAAVDVAALEETYGCPDCADGGAATLTFTPADGGPAVTSTYEFGNPPPELAAVDAVTAPVVDALSTCEPSPLVEPGPGCEPLF